MPLRSPKDTISNSNRARTADGIHLITAEGGGGADVNANRTNVGPWETFTTKAKVLKDIPLP
jgi:hypothetical protein